MSSKDDANSAPKGASDRDARLKAALKANLQRRKQQARARTASETVSDESKKKE